MSLFKRDCFKMTEDMYGAGPEYDDIKRRTINKCLDDNYGTPRHTKKPGAVKGKFSPKKYRRRSK